MSFSEDMDTAVSPPAALIKFDVDDAQKNATNFTWQTDRMFRAQYNEAVLGPTDVDLKSLTTHPNFKTALGALVFPFDLQAFELDLDATGEYIDPNITIIVEFQSAMNQTVTPQLAEMNIYADDVLKVPASITWQDATHLLITYAEAALGAPILDIELPAATDRLRCLLGSVIPAFRLDTLAPPPP